MGDTSTTKAITARLQTLAGPSRSGGTRTMADLLGMKLPTVDRYVRGERTPPHDFLEAVADRYNVSLDWLYGRQGSGTPEEAAQAEPPWARRLDARLSFLERQLKQQSEPKWARQLMGQVMRNEAMLLILQRTFDVSDEVWEEAVEELRKREDLWAGIEEVLGPLPSLRGVSGADAEITGAGAPSGGGRRRRR